MRACGYYRRRMLRLKCNECRPPGSMGSQSPTFVGIVNSSHLHRTTCYRLGFARCVHGHGALVAIELHCCASLFAGSYWKTPAMTTNGTVKGHGNHHQQSSAATYERVREIMSQPPDRRMDFEINSILPWFRNMKDSKVLGQLKPCKYIDTLAVSHR